MLGFGNLGSERLWVKGLGLRVPGAGCRVESFGVEGLKLGWGLGVVASG